MDDPSQNEAEVFKPLLPSKTYDESEMDITPMIDMTFLLLIFFLVASKMDAGANVKLPPARHGTAVVEKTSVILTVAAGEGGKATIYKGNGIVPENLIRAPDVETEENEVTAYVENELITSGKLNVLIKAERGVKHREVSRISKAATKPEDVQQLYVAVLEVR
jgi:biopolymer transport protein ExbD